MDFNDLERLVDVLLGECETDFEPSFIRQAEAICQWDSTIYSNIDSISALLRRLDGAQRDQSEVDVSVQLIEEKLVELEQSITQLEHCPQEVALPWLARAWPPVTSSQQATAERNKIFYRLWGCQFLQIKDNVRLILLCSAETCDSFRTLLEVASRMDDPDREWPPFAGQLKVMISDHRRCYEKHFPVLGVLACHTETLMAVEKQLDTITDRLAANEKLFRQFCPRVEEHCKLGEFCYNMLTNK